MVGDFLINIGKKMQKVAARNKLDVSIGVAVVLMIIFVVVQLLTIKTPVKDFDLLSNGEIAELPLPALTYNDEGDNFVQPLAAVPSFLNGREYVLNRAGFLSVVDPRSFRVVEKIYVGEHARLLIGNPNLNRLYVGNSDGSLTIIDLADETVRNVKVAETVTSMILNSITNKIFIADARGKRLQVFDSLHNEKIAEINLGIEPSNIGKLQLNNMIYLVSRKDQKLVLVDGERLEVTKTVELDFEPVFVFSTEAASYVVITGVLPNVMAIHDVLTGEEKARVELQGEPTFATVTQGERMMYVSTNKIDHDNLLRVDTTDWSFVDSFSIKGIPANQIVRNGKVFVANGLHHTLSVIDMKSGESEETVELDKQYHSLLPYAFSESGTVLLLSYDGALAEFSPEDKRLIRTLSR